MREGPGRREPWKARGQAEQDEDRSGGEARPRQRRRPDRSSRQGTHRTQHRRHAPRRITSDQNADSEARDTKAHRGQGPHEDHVAHSPPRSTADNAAPAHQPAPQGTLRHEPHQTAPHHADSPPSTSSPPQTAPADPAPAHQPAHRTEPPRIASPRHEPHQPPDRHQPQHPHHEQHHTDPQRHRAGPGERRAATTTQHRSASKGAPRPSEAQGCEVGRSKQARAFLSMGVPRLPPGAAAGADTSRLSPRRLSRRRPRARRGSGRPARSRTPRHRAGSRTSPPGRPRRRR